VPPEVARAGDAEGVPRAKPLLIFPCNGNGLEALDCLGSSYECIGFIDDTPEKRGANLYGHPVFSRAALGEFPDAEVLAVPGGPSSFRSRANVIDGLGIDAARWATVIHPHARVSPLARVGRNVLIMAGVVVTSNAVIGDHVCILPNTVVHHDVVIGAWSLVGSNVTMAGSAVIGANCYIGSGSSVKNGLRIGDGALVGLATTVIRDVAAGVTVAGSPARTIR
jgi:sugar O-acyltransferase (sialic acid O-acetyltransferase NeuD family)